LNLLNPQFYLTFVNKYILGYIDLNIPLIPFFVSIYRLKALFQKSRQMSDREKQEEEGKCQQEVSGDTTPTLGARGSQRLATQRKRQATQLLIAWRHLDTARRFMQVFTTVLMACAWR